MSPEKRPCRDALFFRVTHRNRNRLHSRTQRQLCRDVAISPSSIAEAGGRHNLWPSATRNSSPQVPQESDGPVPGLRRLSYVQNHPNKTKHE